MATRAELRTRVREYLDEPTADFWTDAQINNWINQAYNYCYHIVVQADEGFFRSVVLVNIVADQADYALPTNHLKTRLLERVFDTYTIPLRVFDRIESVNFTSATGLNNLYVPSYRLVGQNITLEPTPIESITNGLRHEFVTQPVPMNADGDSPNAGFVDMWQEGIVLKAVISAKEKEEAIVGSGADVSAFVSDFAAWQQMIKEAAEIRVQGRRYTETFGGDDTNYFL